MRAKISPADLAVLIKYVVRGETHPNVGYEDASVPIGLLLKILKAPLRVRISHVESALWSCNLCSEQGVWDEAEPFGAFVRRITPEGYRFSMTYNFFRKVLRHA